MAVFDDLAQQPGICAVDLAAELEEGALGMSLVEVSQDLARVLTRAIVEGERDQLLVARAVRHAAVVAGRAARADPLEDPALGPAAGRRPRVADDAAPAAGPAHVGSAPLPEPRRRGPVAKPPVCET